MCTRGVRSLLCQFAVFLALFPGGDPTLTADWLKLVDGYGVTPWWKAVVNRAMACHVSALRADIPHACALRLPESPAHYSVAAHGEAECAGRPNGAKHLATSPRSTEGHLHHVASLSRIHFLRTVLEAFLIPLLLFYPSQSNTIFSDFWHLLHVLQNSFPEGQSKLR